MLRLIKKDTTDTGKIDLLCIWKKNMLFWIWLGSIFRFALRQIVESYFCSLGYWLCKMSLITKQLLYSTRGMIELTSINNISNFWRSRTHSTSNRSHFCSPAFRKHLFINLYPFFMRSPRYINKEKFSMLITYWKRKCKKSRTI